MIVDPPMGFPSFFSRGALKGFLETICRGKGDNAKMARTINIMSQCVITSIDGDSDLLKTLCIKEGK